MKDFNKSLSYQLRRLYILVFLTSVLLTACIYFALSWGNHRQSTMETRNALENLLTAQAPFLTQELVNDRFYAAVIRGKDLALQHASSSLLIGVYRPDGSLIFESPGLKLLGQTQKGDNETETLRGDYVLVSKDLKFAGETIGSVVLGQKVDLSPHNVLRNTLIVVVAILLAYLLALFVLTRLYLERHVLTPIRSITNAIPKIGEYLNGQETKIWLPESVGTEELDRILRTLSSVSERLKTALHLKKEAELQIARNTTAESLARQVAHDIRSPLAVLRTAVSDLAPLPEEERVLILNSVRRINDIANNLLSQHRGPGESHLRAEDLSAILETVVSEKRAQKGSTMGPRLERISIQSSYGLFSRLHAVELMRVLSNVIDNSFEAISDTGSILVRLDRTLNAVLGECARISVKDDGRGIPEEILTRLGSEELSYGKAQGNGLGLIHARRTVESWGGRMSIISKLGAGTEVSLVIPLVSPPVWFVPKLEVRLPCRLVIVDDDNLIHDVWEKRFSALGERWLRNAHLSVHHLYEPTSLLDWLASEGASRQGRETLFLIDFEFSNTATSGLDLIETARIASQSVLVTNRFEDERIREVCTGLGLRLLSKGVAHSVPIYLDEGNLLAPSTTAINIGTRQLEVPQS